MTGVGRVCGVSDSSAPSSTTVSHPELADDLQDLLAEAAPAHVGLDAAHQHHVVARRPGGRHTENRVVGHSTRRDTPSTSETVGRLTWKS